MACAQSKCDRVNWRPNRQLEGGKEGGPWVIPVYMRIRCCLARSDVRHLGPYGDFASETTAPGSPMSRIGLKLYVISIVFPGCAFSAASSPWAHHVGALCCRCRRYSAASLRRRFPHPDILAWLNLPLVPPVSDLYGTDSRSHGLGDAIPSR